MNKVDFRVACIDGVFSGSVELSSRYHPDQVAELCVKNIGSNLRHATEVDVTFKINEDKKYKSKVSVDGTEYLTSSISEVA